MHLFFSSFVPEFVFCLFFFFVVKKSLMFIFASVFFLNIYVDFVKSLSLAGQSEVS